MQLEMDVSSAKNADTSNPRSSGQAMLVQITTDGVPKLHCPVCNKALVSLNGYVKHMKKHEPPGGFLCRYCDAHYCSEEELKRHRDKVHTTIACRICKDTNFTLEDEYREHIRIVHNGIDREMFKCEMCGAEYKTMDPYRRHVDTQCGTIKPHKCDQCPMTFVTKYNLKQHKQSHTGERKYCCSYCGKNFVQKGRLVEHERSHTGEKPYKCDVCGKCFAHRESIVTHSSIHTGIRLVQCKCCQARFSCYSNLIKHRRTRPDTCGLPQYDPPKNRVRTHRSRIPPTLNPTSEIKVSIVNKIIKPVHKEQSKKVNQKSATEKESQPAYKRKKKAAGSRKPKTRKKEDIPSESESSQTSDDESGYKGNYEVEDAGDTCRRQTRSSQAKQNGGMANTSKEDKANNSTWDGDSDMEEDYLEYDPADSGSEDDQKQQEWPAPMLSIKVEQSDLDDPRKPPSFEYKTTIEVLNTDLSVKSEEDEANIFNEKDKLLDCLLNDGEHVSFAECNYLPSKKSHMNAKPDELVLQETEVVLVKDELNDNIPEEDILEVKNFPDTDSANSKLRLDDVAKLYKELTEDSSDEQTISEVQKRKTKLSAAIGTKRKYRKRTETVGKAVNTSTPKRVAKISQQELKDRLKMLKRDEKSWPCPHCIKIYHMRKPFERHLREDHKRPEEEIKEMFKSEELEIINDEIFKCHICDKIYLVEKRLLAHVKLHGPEGTLTFKCPCYCSLYFATKDEATLHAQKEHRDLLYCELCERFMTGHDSLKNHIKNHHSEKASRSLVRNLVCDKCGKKFSGRTSLTDHVRSDCGRVPLYPCTICGKHLTTAGILKTHLLLHKDETPYQCDKCGKTFKVKAQYKTHLKTRHTDYKPFKCHLCPKEYPYRESLLTHMTVHTGIKRFLCNGCGKRFTCISNLQAHRKVHADSCGALPLNAKATQYMGVQKGNLLLGSKPEAGLDYNETNTLIAREVLDRDLPMAQELNFPSEPSAPLATVPLNYARGPPPHLLLPQMVMSQFVDDSHSSPYN